MASKAQLIAQLKAKREKEDQELVDKLWMHISIGELNKDGDPVGYHWKGDTKNAVLEGFDAKSPLGKCGVYTQKVRHKLHKSKVKGQESTFFPDEWTAQEVKEALLSASHQKVAGYGEVSKPVKAVGLKIVFMGDGSTAFPMYEAAEEEKETKRGKRKGK
jgi:hypothetical protein